MEKSFVLAGAGTLLGLVWVALLTGQLGLLDLHPLDITLQSGALTSLGVIQSKGTVHHLLLGVVTSFRRTACNGIFDIQDITKLGVERVKPWISVRIN